MNASHNLFIAFVAALGVASATGCDNDPAKDKAKVAASEPVAVNAAPVAPAGAAKYVFSNADSKVAFTGAKVTGKHDGGFNTFSGTIDVADADPTKSALTAEIDLASLQVDDAKLAGHLKSADFFDVAKFTKAKFTSTSIKAGGEKGATHTITGNLDLHGITKSISFPATIKVEGDKIDAAAEFAINRKDFAITYPGKPDDLIKDDVLIKLTIHAKKP